MSKKVASNVYIKKNINWVNLGGEENYTVLLHSTKCAEFQNVLALKNRLALRFSKRYNEPAKKASGLY